MKLKFLLFFAIFIFALGLSAGKVDVKVHGRVSTKYTKLNEEFALFAGFNGAVIFNDSFILGAGGYGLATDNEYECSQECIDKAGSDYNSSCRERNGTVKKSDFSIGYGGLIAGYQFNPLSFLDIELKSLIGGGIHSSYYRNYDFKVSFFVFEPELAVKLVITKYIAVAFGISYRVVAAMDNDTAYTFEDLSALAGTFDICLGSF